MLIGLAVFTALATYAHYRGLRAQVAGTGITQMAERERHYSFSRNKTWLG
jgi:hypothetical protein